MTLKIQWLQEIASVSVSVTQLNREVRRLNRKSTLVTISYLNYYTKTFLRYVKSANPRTGGLYSGLCSYPPVGHMQASNYLYTLVLMM